MRISKRSQLAVDNPFRRRPALGSPYSQETLARLVQIRRRRALSRAAGSTPEFRGAALRAQAETSREWIIAGPSETGKTWASLWRLNSLLASTPGAQATLVRKVRATVYSTVMVTFRRILARSGTSAAAYGGERPEWFDYPSGSRLWIAGIDDPGKALSAERDFIYVNQAEELSVADWEVLTTRATGRGAVTTTPMVFGDCNPGPPGHWIKARATAGHLTLLESRHQDNPSLWDGTAWTDQGRRTMETLDRLTGVRRLRLRDGLWVSAEGAVYEFDPAVHIIPRQPIPQEWTRIRSVDFGFTNPFVCQWWAIDPDGRMILYRELYMTRRTVRAHAEQINRLSAGERIEATVADHDAEDRATLAEAGIHTVPADKAISPGVQAVEARLAPAADGKPRLLVMEGSLVERDETLAAAHLPVCTRDEFDVYVWPKDSAGKAIKETPVDLHNHSMDCLRYAVRWADRFARAAASPAPKFRGPPIHDRMSRPDRHQFR